MDTEYGTEQEKGNLRLRVGVRFLRFLRSHGTFYSQLRVDMTITLTDRAADQIRQVANEEEVSFDDTLLRVAVVPGGCSGLTYDLGWDTTVQEEDTVEEHGNITVVLDKESRLYLDGSELDFTDGLNGEGFHFKNPQATRECACGESFAL